MEFIRLIPNKNHNSLQILSNSFGELGRNRGPAGMTGILRNKPDPTRSRNPDLFFKQCRSLQKSRLRLVGMNIPNQLAQR